MIDLVKREKVETLVRWLNENRKDMAPYEARELLRFFRISDANPGAFCFVAKEDFENKTLGKVIEGGLYLPRTWSLPAKHMRGHIDKPEEWEKVFGPWGMRTLR